MLAAPLPLNLMLRTPRRIGGRHVPIEPTIPGGDGEAALETRPLQSGAIRAAPSRSGALTRAITQAIGSSYPLTT